MRTADNPDSLRGAGLDGVVLDEAATMKQDAWDLVLRPALADRKGWALFISTPQHFNWFHALYEMGEDPANEEWESWQFPTWTNPFIPEGEIEAARKEMAEEDWDQEFGASFTAVGGAIFRLLSADRLIYLRPMPSGLEFRRTGVGMDWGTTKDHQAAVVCASRLSSGAVWIRSAWLSDSGSADDWVNEAQRCKKDYKASFARVDRSQSSIKDRLRDRSGNNPGFTDVENGKPDVEARIGDFQSLVKSRNIYFDMAGPGVRDYYDHLCAYHRDKDGRVVEEVDDDVDAGCYVVSGHTEPAGDLRPLGSLRMQAAPQRQRSNAF